MSERQALTHAVESTNLADLLERILDKGVVVAGDVSIKLVDIELLKIELRLVICSVDRARELGLDWWNHPLPGAAEKLAVASFEERLGRLEAASAARLAGRPPAGSERP